MRRNNDSPVNVFDKQDVRFRGLLKTMESVYQSLYKEGVGVEIRHASIITEEEEERLWKIIPPKALVRSVFFLNGKNFCLRGVRNTRNLKLSQFVCEKDHWKYIETGSKNFRGGVADLRRENKVVRQYPCSQLGNRCHFYLWIYTWRNYQ